MDKYKASLLDEKSELKLKIDILQKEIDKHYAEDKNGIDDMTMLRYAQLNNMIKYHECLRKRIDLLNSEKEK
ncbi:MAG: hypothetical protein M0R51_13340 [Clostridia bacterium]|nr:hypothetical protein [Clostridia bacterium]MDD3086221.1 hypothetical protein [Candidatus ainarchaeum sp.]